MELCSSVFFNSAAISVLRVTSGLPPPFIRGLDPRFPVSAYVNFYSRPWSKWGFKPYIIIYRENEVTSVGLAHARPIN